MFALVLGASSASLVQAQERTGTRRQELNEARDALREGRQSRACMDRMARVRRAVSNLEEASRSADRSQRRRLHQARERLQDCLYDHSNAVVTRRGPPTTLRTTPAPVRPAGPSFPTIVTTENGSLLNSGAVLADLRNRGADVRSCVAQHPANIRSPFRMTLTLQANGRYAGLRVPASATPPLVQCLARTVPRWQVQNGAVPGTYRVDVHLHAPSAAAARPAAATVRPTVRATPTPTPTPVRPTATATPAPAAARVHVLNARNQRVTSGAVLQDLERRAAALQTCASSHPGNIPPLFQFTITLNATGQLVSVRMPAGLNVTFEGCVQRETVAWRVQGAGPGDAGLYAMTVMLR